MSNYRKLSPRQGLRVALVLGALATALLVSPSAMAEVHFGFALNLDLPPGVHVSVGNYEPYYVGRVFYQPLAVWRPVYSFPVETPYGVVYEPYVYDHGRVICSNYIPGPDAGYGQFIVEGRGYYSPNWYHGRSVYGYGGHGGWHDRASYAPYRGWNHGQAYQHEGGWNRGGNGGRGGEHGSRGTGHGNNGHERGGSRGHHGNDHRH